MRVSQISLSERFNSYAMRRPTRRDVRSAAAAGSAEAPVELKLANTPMSDLINDLANGRVTATALTKGYLSRIEAHDRDRTMLNSVREINPDALTIAGKLDGMKPSAQAAARWRADPGKGQHRDRRQAANDCRLAGAEGCTRQG